ncbi:MAG: DNA (cytosine-5-)-methyltransferase [Parcubacteria group bacterium Gr01-1014_8]|nr:MAG: DNA (cytosine-5-)-methyltransferase [Parcubacteria group bacterium Gr01-1014_8]
MDIPWYDLAMGKLAKHTLKKDDRQAVPLKVIELFAGVGGFRLGLDQASKKEAARAGLKFETIWSNQWEPSTKRQHASEVYRARFGSKGHSNQDIATVATGDIPDHHVLVGGFPCQDYSVARTLSQAAGLQGKKGVLWWQIYRILQEKGHKDSAPYVFLENVDRLLKSPASARGRDFAIMLASLANLGYVVEWRVINAADYGKPQRRRRIFILAFKNGTGIANALRSTDAINWLTKEGVFAQRLAVEDEISRFARHDVADDPVRITRDFEQLFPDDIDFANAGVMSDGRITTARVTPKYGGPFITLGDILLPEHKVAEEYFINGSLKEWKYLKGAKKEERHGTDGFTYHYAEGPMTFPDALDKPSRTIITGEGGPAPSRFKHVVKTKSGKYRRLTPTELELLCQFPARHTAYDDISDVKRAFFMGNALVVGIIEEIGRALLQSIKRHEEPSRRVQRFDPHLSLFGAPTR